MGGVILPLSSVRTYTGIYRDTYLNSDGKGRGSSVCACVLTFADTTILTPTRMEWAGSSGSCHACVLTSAYTTILTSTRMEWLLVNWFLTCVRTYIALYQDTNLDPDGMGGVIRFLPCIYHILNHLLNNSIRFVCRKGKIHKKLRYKHINRHRMPKSNKSEEIRHAVTD